MQLDRKKWTGIGIGVLAVILFSSKAVMVKLAYNYKVDTISILLLRMLFSFPFYVVIACINHKKNKHTTLQKKDYYWVVFFGVIGYYLASYFDFVGLTYIKASLERIILFIYPTIVIILNKIFLKHAISKVQLTAILLTYLGVVFTFLDELAWSGTETYLGIFFVVLSAITYAAYLVGSGWLIPKFGTVKFTAYAMIVSCLCVFIHYGLTSHVNLFSFTWQVYVLGFLIAVFATVIPSFLVSISIKKISSSNFAIVAGVGPISTIILAAVFLQETLTLLQFFGALVVISGIMYMSLNKAK